MEPGHTPGRSLRAPRPACFSRLALLSLTLVLALVASLATAVPAGAAPKKGGAGGCKGKACGSDTTAPTGAVGSPAAGSTLTGIVTASGSAADNAAVAKVEVKLGSLAYATATGTTSWSRTIDTRLVADGAATLAARITDTSGNATTVSVAVTVANAAKGGDATAPAVAITAPAALATVAGTAAVAGTASDAGGLGGVEVRVDGGPWNLASGLSSWSYGLDTTALADGTHTVEARATDTSGNTAATTVAVVVDNTPAPAPGVQDILVQDPKSTSEIALLGRGRIASNDQYSLVLYAVTWSYPARFVAFVRDATSGATSFVDLPNPGGSWTDPNPVVTDAGELWVLSGDAPVNLRHYQLTGSPLPTSAALVEHRTFGDSDSRMGALTRLGSGAMVAVWHQQGITGSEGHGVAYRRVDGSWQEQFMNWALTRASKDALVQHPADGSVWLFNNADAWGAIGAAHFTETANGLYLDWADHSWISAADGQFDSDPENPDVVVAVDPSAGEIVVAYQSAVRKTIGAGLVGSYPAVARITASGSRTFAHLPVWVERVSRLGLSVVPGEVWLTYRLVDATDLSSDRTQARVLRGGAWSAPLELGRTLDSPNATPDRAEVAVNRDDASLHLFTLA